MLYNQLGSNSCPPCPSDDSIFFNLILGIDYENTKENCLIFLRNYSKQIFYSKREIFKIVINELTLNGYSDNMIGNVESIYLIRQLIKKYTKNNIINALYEFVSEKDNEILPHIEIKNNIDISNNFSLSEKEPKNENDKFKNIQEKEKNNEKEQINEKDDGCFKNNNKERININFLEKKRKNDSSLNDSKEANKVYPIKNYKNHKNMNNDTNEDIKNDKNKEDEEIKKEDKNEAEEQFNEKKEEKEKNIKKEKEKKDKIKNIEKSKIIGDEGNMEKKGIKKESDNIKEEKKNNENENKEVNLRHKNKLKSMPFNKNYISLISQIDNKPNRTKINKKRYFSIEEVIKLESSEEIQVNNIMNIYPINSLESKSINSKINNQSLPNFNIKDSQEGYSSDNQIKENKFRNHLIKYCDKDNNIFIFSYKLKKIGGKNKKEVFFVCNNKRCRGKGVYDMDNKIFRETVKHSVPISFHKLASKYIDIKDILLNDHDCNGYQVLNNYNFIKDKNAIMINN